MPYIAEYIVAIFADAIVYQKFYILKLKFQIKFLYKKNSQKLQETKANLEQTYLSNEKRKSVRENQEPYKIIIKRNKNVKWLILIMAICAFTGFLTPLGNLNIEIPIGETKNINIELPVPYLYLVKTMQGNTTQNINEHLPLTLAENTPIMCAIIIFLSWLTFTKAKIKLSDLFMIGGLTYLMFCTKRQATMFAIVGSIILNRMVVNTIEVYGVCEIKEITKKFVNIVTICIITIPMILLSKEYINDKKDDAFVSESTYPVKVADWILENLDVENIKLFNEYNYGSYLLYRGIPVFIDSRADLYAPEFNGGEDIFTDFINTSNIGKYYGSTFKKYEITHVLVYKNAKIRMLIDNTEPEKYTKIYSDDNFVLYKIEEY